MGSKKHKKHKSERREKFEDRNFSLERPPSLKLIFKVNTPEHGSSDSPRATGYGIQSDHEHLQRTVTNNDSAHLMCDDDDDDVTLLGKNTGNISGVYDVAVVSSTFNDTNVDSRSEKHKKSKKKKKKKDREKKHKHHKEKRSKHRSTVISCDDSSQEEISYSEDNTQFQEHILRYAGMSTTNSLSSVPVTKPMIAIKSMDQSSMTDQEDNINDQQDQQSSSSSSLHYQQQQQPQRNEHKQHHVYQQHNEHSSPLSSDLQSQTSNSIQPVHSNKSMDSNLKSPVTPQTDIGGREQRSCVLKLKQSKSPLSKLLDHLLRSLEKKDPHQFFAWPVTEDIAPGYLSIISEPMDFLSIRQKVDENQYTTLQEFTDDFKLMCDNAIRYNHVETVYHKAAKRLLHVGLKMLQPDALMRSLRPLMMYMKELSAKELGFELTNETSENDIHTVDSADECLSTGTEENNVQTVQLEDDEKKKRESDPLTKFEAFVDDLTTEEVLAQVQNAAKTARKRLMGHRYKRKMGFLRQEKDGTTSMKILVDVPNDCPERVITVGAFTGKLQQGTGQLQGFREDRRNAAKLVKPLNYGTFCSFAPVYDSRFANLSREESELILNTYGDETGNEYAESIMEFSKDSFYANTLANSLLDVLTNGEHRKTMNILMENQRQRIEQKEIEETIINPTVDEMKKMENIKIDFDSLKSLNDLGIDTNFINHLEQHVRTIEKHKKIEEQLNTTSTLIEQLHQVQTQRLSQTLPTHLSLVSRPNSDELQLADQITLNLTEMAKQLPPDNIITPHALRKAMGLSNVGLEPITIPRLSLSNVLLDTGLNINQNDNADMDVTPVPMDIEPEQLIPNNNNTNINTLGSTLNTSEQQLHTQPPVDLESELREFLEGDDGGIDHMLMD